MLRTHVSLRRQSVDVAMVAANEVGEIVYTNPAVTNLFGYTAAEMQGRNVRALLCARVFWLCERWCLSARTNR